MSLKAFHIVFITLSLILCVTLTLWGLQGYFQTGNTMQLVIALVFAVSLIPLGLYANWFWKKMRTFPKAALILSLISSMVWQHLPSELWACAVCFKGPDSPMTKGAQSGALLLAGVVYLLLFGIAGIAFTWFRRARSLSAKQATS